MAGEHTVAVGLDNRVSFADSRMPGVLATPRLVGYLELAARDAIAACLDEHERSVGVMIDFTR